MSPTKGGGFTNPGFNEGSIGKFYPLLVARPPQ